MAGQSRAMATLLWSLWVLAPLCQGAPAGDLVEQLPGWDRPLLSKTHSGYISAGQEDGYTMHEHYLFFESEGDPRSDPLIMWTNGGPGASSFFGSFSELGPYYLTDASLRTEAYRSSGVPTLFENTYRWTKLGSLLIRNLPPPVGFSYCDPAGPSGDGYSCGSWNDTKTAKHSFEFMKNWLAAFPEYTSNDLFLIGESYAGLYVPMLAREILNAGPAGPAAQLKGFAVGDGCLGGGHGCVPNDGPFFSVEFFHGHGQFSDKTYAEIQRVCPREELVNGVSTPACKAALDRMDEEKGYSFAYNLYDECYDFALSDALPWHETRKWWGPPRHQTRQASMSDTWHMDGSPCGGTAVLPRWTNTTAVKRALHVADNAHFFTGDNGVGFTYNSTSPSLVPWYRDLVLKNRLRILIYNGDTDPGLNSFYAQNWTAAVGIPEVEPWRPWTRDGKTRMGGFVTRYENNFDFLTIRGSGHMVPEYKPEAAFVMLSSFLSNSEYPRYQPPSSVQRQPQKGVEVVV
eukprot:TRINITY_DN33876_c0_g1_i1.p1 TRINITY_DN33876_c0_g1~~TRINITY_DN33876_c0_g1_i1.p1  ORF type:complete len:515 (-),score=67.70 TRINITY_DN33876_c0_g1_i1:233-1777(-)